MYFLAYLENDHFLSFQRCLLLHAARGDVARGPRVHGGWLGRHDDCHVAPATPVTRQKENYVVVFFSEKKKERKRKKERP